MNSTIQGYVVSILGCNGLFNILSRRMVKAAPVASPTYYYDDRFGRAPLLQVGVFVDMWPGVVKFGGLSGQRLNIQKTKSLSAGVASHRVIKEVLPPEIEIVCP